MGLPRTALSPDWGTGPSSDCPPDRRYWSRDNASTLGFVSEVGTITLLDRVPNTDPELMSAKPARVRFPAVIWVLLGGSLLVRSAGFAYPFLAFHVAERGNTAGAVGLVLAGFGLGWAAGQLLCGWLVDWLGARGTLVATMSVAATTLILMAGAHSVSALLAGAIVAGLVCDAPRPVLGAAITTLVSDPRRRAKLDSLRFGWILNAGAGIAGGVGGLLAGWWGTPVLYWINGIACAAFAVVAALFIPSCGVAGAATKAGYRQAFSDARLVLLCISSVATLTAMVGFITAVPMLMRAGGLGAGAYGFVQVVNAVAVTALTPLLSPWLSKQLATRSRLDILAGAGVWMTACMAAAALAHTTTGFALATAAGAPGEIAWFVIGAGLVHRIAPAANPGSYHGMWSMTMAAAAIIAPILAVWSLGHGGRVLIAVTTVTVGLLGAALCLPMARVVAGADELPADRREPAHDLRA